jgi:hypothetical protein
MKRISLQQGLFTLSLLFSLSSLYFGYIAFFSALLIGAMGCFLSWMGKVYVKPAPTELDHIRDEMELERLRSLLEEMKYQIQETRSKRDLRASSQKSESKYMF